MYKITLTNDFHNTSVTLRMISRFPTANQVRRAKKALCGFRSCTCSGVLGTRGFQEHAIIGKMEEWREGGLIPSIDPRS